MKQYKLLALAAIPLLLVGCAAGSTEFAETQAGFFTGIWHGWIAPFAIILHFLYDDSFRIYEPNNTGIAYDIGFYIAIISGFGSLGISRRKRKKKD